MAAKPAPAPVEEVVQPKKSGNGLMIVLIVLIVVLIAAVGGLAFTVLGHKDAPKEGERAAAETHQEEYKPQDHAVAYSPTYKQFHAPAAGSPPQFFDMDQLVVNFKGEGKAKHLAIKIKMMTTYPDVVSELMTIKPILVNDISAALRKKTYTELNADDAQELIAQEILKITRSDLEAQKVYPDLLDKILIERFVMQ